MSALIEATLPFDRVSITNMRSRHLNLVGAEAMFYQCHILWKLRKTIVGEYSGKLSST